MSFSSFLRALVLRVTALVPSKVLAARLRWAFLPGPSAEDEVAYNTDNHKHLTALHEQYGDTFVARRRNGKKVLFVRSPASVRGVLLSEHFGKVWATEGDTGSASDKPSVSQYVHNLVQPLLTDPVFSNKGSVNRDARTMLQPLFTSSKVFKRGFAAEIDYALTSWPTDKTVDALALAHDLIRGALYHAIAGDSTAGLHSITPAFHEALAHFVSRYEQPCHDGELTDMDEQMMVQLQTSAVAVAGAFRRQRQRAGKSGDDSDSIASEGGSDNGAESGSQAEEPEARSLLALMLDAGCTDDEAGAVLVNTVIAGAEAPASALAHTLQELAFSTGVQQQVRAEVVAAAGPMGAAVEALERLPYTKSTVLEGLRLFAPATLVKRQALCDAEVDGFMVPKGTVVELCVTAIHLDPKQFANPTSFEPSRSGPTAAALLGRERCFMPFSGGQRGCPGRQLAVTMLHTALASIVQRFELLPASADAVKKDFDASYGATVSVRKFVEWPSQGIPMRLAPVRNDPLAAISAIADAKGEAKSDEAAADVVQQGPTTRETEACRWAKQGLAPPSVWMGNKSKSHDGDLPCMPGPGMIPLSNSRDGLPRVPFTSSRDGNMPRIPPSNSKERVRGD